MITRKICAADSGNSPYIQIPRDLARILNWKKGDAIEITPDTEKQTLTLRKK
jgi:antitoxin component of MazEF toxin-antitoxin module